MYLCLLVFLGCGLGGILRYLLSSQIQSYLGQNFPYGTLTVNVIGSFLMGLLSALIINKLIHYTNLTKEEANAILLTGLLGGFTTFSSFSLETINLIKNGNLSSALLYVGLSLMLCIACTWLGLVAAGKY